MNNIELPFEKKLKLFDPYYYKKHKVKIFKRLIKNMKDFGVLSENIVEVLDAITKEDDDRTAQILHDFMELIKGTELIEKNLSILLKAIKKSHSPLAFVSLVEGTPTDLIVQFISEFLDTLLDLNHYAFENFIIKIIGYREKSVLEKKEMNEILMFLNKLSWKSYKTEASVSFMRLVALHDDILRTHYSQIESFFRTILTELYVIEFTELIGWIKTTELFNNNYSLITEKFIKILTNYQFNDLKTPFSSFSGIEKDLRKLISTIKDTPLLNEYLKNSHAYTLLRTFSELLSNENGIQLIDEKFSIIINAFIKTEEKDKFHGFSRIIEGIKKTKLMEVKFKDILNMFNLIPENDVKKAFHLLIDSIVKTNLIEDKYDDIVIVINKTSLKEKVKQKIRSRLIKKEFEINKFITLKLEGGNTNIYINGELFQEPKSLMLNTFTIPIQESNSIESLDDIVESLGWNVWGRGGGRSYYRQNGQGFIEEHLSPEIKFWGHCSNLQVWTEHDYDIHLLHSKLAFPLLKELTEAGDPIAQKVFNIEVIKRFESGNLSVIEYILEEDYIEDLNYDEVPEEFTKINELYRDHRLSIQDVRVLLFAKKYFPDLFSERIKKIDKYTEEEICELFRAMIARADSFNEERIIDLMEIIIDFDNRLFDPLICCFELINKFKKSKVGEKYIFKFLEIIYELGDYIEIYDGWDFLLGINSKFNLFDLIEKSEWLDTHFSDFFEMVKKFHSKEKVFSKLIEKLRETELFEKYITQIKNFVKDDIFSFTKHFRREVELLNE